MDKTVLIRCDDPMFQFIDKMSKNACVSKSGWIRMVVKSHQNKIENNIQNSLLDVLSNQQATAQET